MQESINHRNKRKLIIVLLVLCTFTAATLLILSSLYKPVPLISVRGLDEQQAAMLTSYLSSGETGFDTEVELLFPEEADPGRTPDILFQPKDYRLISSPDNYRPLNPDAGSSMPRSITRIGVIGEQQIALPVALDHVEIAFRRDLFAANGLPVQDRILSLSELESVLNRLIGSRFFPLVIAGGNDGALLDFVSVLVLSLGGVEQYQELVRLAETQSSAEGLVSAHLGGGWSLSEAVTLLKEWEQQRILHPDWASFSHEDVLEFAQRQLTGAVVMRLSQHRTWPLHVLRRWQSSPFPFKDPTKAGSGLITPVLIAAVPKDAARADEAVDIVPSLVSRDFQDTAVQSWRLAPVHSTAQALDRESGDLRFWAAASRELLPPLSDALSPQAAAELVAQLRVVL